MEIASFDSVNPCLLDTVLYLRQPTDLSVQVVPVGQRKTIFNVVKAFSVLVMKKSILK